MVVFEEMLEKYKEIVKWFIFEIDCFIVSYFYLICVLFMNILLGFLYILGRYFLLYYVN